MKTKSWWFKAILKLVYTLDLSILESEPGRWFRTSWSQFYWKLSQIQSQTSASFIFSLFFVFVFFFPSLLQEARVHWGHWKRFDFLGFSAAFVSTVPWSPSCSLFPVILLSGSPRSPSVLFSPLRASVPWDLVLQLGHWVGASFLPSSCRKD